MTAVGKEVSMATQNSPQIVHELTQQKPNSNGKSNTMCNIAACQHNYAH
jgi:hypothetical protein